MFHTAIYRLTAWFLAILMAVSLIFSIAIFYIITTETNDRLYRLQTELEERGLGSFISSDPLLSSTFQQDQQLAIVQNTIISLVAVNIFVFFVGGAICYLLSRSLVGRIERAHDAQSRFTTDASHEFKTPLTTMKSELEVALRDKKLSKGEMRELLISNLEEVNRLSKLAQTLLLLSRLDYANLTMRPVDLAALLAEAINLSASKGMDSESFDITLPSYPIMVEGNESSLRELFMILIDNALKYRYPDTKVKLRLGIQNKRVVFKISNSGPGIKPEKLPYIFDRFFRADESRSAGRGGTGLGLALAKEIVKLHNGEISAVSHVNKRTRFTVILPMKR